MIIRPTTPQVIQDVVAQLNSAIMPLMPDSTTQIRLFMIMSVLNNCAARADREIAIMKAEIADYTAYATDVAAATGNSTVSAAVSAISPSDDLHLTAVSEEYARASEAMSVAIETALDFGNGDLIARGETLLQARILHEQQMASVADAGR